MTDQEKVNRMFEIRKQEMPDHCPESIKRIQMQIDSQAMGYWALLEMYNERFPEGEQGKLF